MPTCSKKATNALLESSQRFWIEPSRDSVPPVDMGPSTPLINAGRVHFARNLLALVPGSHHDMVAAVFPTVFSQPDPNAVARTGDRVPDQLGDQSPRIALLMDDARSATLAFAGFRRDHWTKVCPSVQRAGAARAVAWFPAVWVGHQPGCRSSGVAEQSSTTGRR